MTDRNIENLNILRETLASKKDKVAVFVGAGTSAPTGIKTWKDILKDFALLIIDTHFNSDQKELESYLQAMIDKFDFPEIASDIYNKLNDREKYLEFMSEKFEPTNCTFTSIHLNIIKVFKTIITTNYDAIFEDAFNEKGISANTQKLPNFSLITLLNQPTVVYLHGNNDQRKYLFMKEEYDAYYPSISGCTKNVSRELERFLETIFTELTLIFIGFSFQDKYFRYYLNKVNKEKERNSRTHEYIFDQKNAQSKLEHFVIIEEKTDEGLIDELKKIGIKPIFYKDRHIKIENILKNIAPTKLEDETEDPSHA